MKARKRSPILIPVEILKFSPLSLIDLLTLTSVQIQSKAKKNAKKKENSSVKTQSHVSKKPRFVMALFIV